MSDPDHPPPHTWDLRATGKVECIWEGCNQIPTQAEHSAALQQAETAMGGRFLIDWRFPAALPSDRRPAEADRWVTIALAASDDADNGPIDLYMVMVHGRAAGERARAAMAAGSRERRESLVEPLRATAFAEVAGATAHAPLSLVVAPWAAGRGSAPKHPPKSNPRQAPRGRSQSAMCAMVPPTEALLAAYWRP